MSFARRVARHVRLTACALSPTPPPTPPFLILFINSICNLACDHCFYWKQLNQRDDLTKEELFALSRSLGPFDHLNLSGGEPFLRPELAEICAQFVRHNGVKWIYCPSNGYFTERTRAQLEELFAEPGLESFAVELSLDGMPAFHDAFRGNPRSFEKAMETYDMLAEFASREPRLRIHAVSTCTGRNREEIKRLTTYLHDRCPQMEHHNIAMLRGERKNATLKVPELAEYRELVNYAASVWADRASGRFGGIVDPMLHWGKERIVRRQAQAIPCRAGRLTGVVYANGDVSVCEERKPIGNLREKPFPEIWCSPEAEKVRRQITGKECFCTSEVFLWPSIVFQPRQLLTAFVGSRAWRRAPPLAPGERMDPHA